MDEEQSAAQPSQVASAIATLIANLPAPVREFVNSPERDQISLELTQKYGLHIDQAGEFERAYLRMLLGVDSPDEFTLSLRQAGIPEATITSLTADVNEMVFKPLRKKEQELSERKVPPAPQPKRASEPIREAPVPQPAPPPPPAPPQPQPVYMPPVQGTQQQTYWVPVSITAVPQPYMTTQPPVQYQMPQAQPVQEPPPAPPPPPPAPEPVPQVAPQVPPPPVWEPQPPPNLPTGDISSSPLKKDYVADPYREPI